MGGQWILVPRRDGRVTMGDYGWSMDSDTPQGIDAVEYGRVLEYPRKRNKISDHEKYRSSFLMKLMCRLVPRS